MTFTPAYNGNRGRIGPGRIGPYSKAFRRGAIGDKISGRTVEGKFIRKVETELTAQLGGAPTFSQQLLIRRVARLALQAELFDAKLSAGKFTEFDGKVFGGVNHAIRLCLLSLGVAEHRVGAPSSPAAASAAPAAASVPDLSQLSTSELDRLYTLLSETRAAADG